MVPFSSLSRFCNGELPSDINVSIEGVTFHFHKGADQVVPRNNITIFTSILCEPQVYPMRNFIVQGYGKSVNTKPHKYKLSFYVKTSVSILSHEHFHSLHSDLQSTKI
ncbi:hypothetical protein Ahy_B02g060377 [Arachis hypogaea]|uniref:DUF223 domain-containing protein n=1 Tax=Arachis hypogaea TaxID=3818 RepID=A0A445AII3_ARAHY|nr:hypothetical protein Ahy_B02g060377 [Arachis hypogaea]